MENFVQKNAPPQASTAEDESQDDEVLPPSESEDGSGKPPGAKR
eukprot:CAMPEP_0174375930 /NCGR_PEP_ID=MMETSP0811_2-20130205/116368_1 /TAXON_ID=73025 ORGANISM="Eutreptiella gymnastica-like, Strain CCMP1594" /NCGR_SAMPLE_ID=MMETSP0811_2 /ASSEMBLY_ACC=CAM_ASM_000667 /LENGTH=43 /DNA_ID= /DNA_START= /DNA_END= /DNA_ORIENTATION=